MSQTSYYSKYLKKQSKEIDNLSEEDKDILLKLLEAGLDDKEEALKPIQIREIVPIEEWVNDSYYIGKAGVSLYDYWKEELIDIFKTENNPQYNEIIIEGGLGCVALDTIYATSLGLNTLSDIIEIKNKGLLEGVTIQSDNGTVKILDVNSVGIKKTKKVTFSNGVYVEGTCDHRIKIIDNDGNIKWCRFDELNKDTNVICSGVQTESFGDFYPYSYLMGSIYGDGGVTYNNGNKNDISIIMMLIQKNSTAFSYIKKEADELGFYPTEVKKNENDFILYRKTDRELIKKWEGIGNSYTKKIPNWFLNCDIKSKCLFLKGLFDADGTVNKSDVSISLCSHVLIKQIQKILFSIGIKSIYRKKDTKCKNKDYYFEGYTYILRITGKENWKKFKNMIGFYVDYKQKKLEDLCKEKRKCNDRIILKPLTKKIQKDIINDKIKISRKNDILKKIRYGSQDITIAQLKLLASLYPEWTKRHDYINYIIKNECSIIYPVEIEDGECECGDITVEGSVYVRDGLINHNTGKSTFATHVVQRFFYEMSCWKNIPALFGLKNTTSISGMYFSLTKEQAEISGFRDIRNLIDDTPYFRDHFPRKEVLDSRLDFPENVFIYYGADVSHQISLNLVLSIVDEANFFKDSKARKQSNNKFMGSKVAELHSSLLNRQASRFSNKEGNKSLSILISSPSFYSSYTQTRIEFAKKNPHAKVIKPRLWDTRPEMYSGKKFFVFLGNERLDPKIIETKDDLNNICESMETQKVESEDVNKALTECPTFVRELIDEVPVEFYENYRTNLPQSIADISAHSVQTQGKLFNSRKVFFSCVDKELPNLFFKTAFTISTNANSKTEPIEYYLRAPFTKQNKERFIHIDQSVSGDCTGIASVYKDDAVYSIDEEGKEHVKFPIVIDFALKIIPPVDGGQIDIEVVRSFVLYMADKLKLKIGKVTYDQFQSTESIQHLKKMGFNAAKQSVESEIPYLSFLKLFYQNEIRMPEQAAELIAEEIFDLQHFRELKKVDHVEGKSKDVCDAVVGAVWGCLNYGNESAKAKHTFEEAQAVVSANARRDLNRRALFSVDSFISRKWK